MRKEELKNMKTYGGGKLGLAFIEGEKLRCAERQCRGHVEDVQRARSQLWGVLAGDISGSSKRCGRNWSVAKRICRQILAKQGKDLFDFGCTQFPAE